MAKRQPIERLAVRAAQEAGVDPDLFVALITRGERSHKGWQTSPAGANGPAQLMPGTAAGLAKKYGINPRDYYGNLLGGAYYLKEQMQRFGDPKLAVAAYNAGPGAVAKYGGVPPYKETQNYVANIFAAYKGAGASAVPEPSVEVPESSTTASLGEAPANDPAAALMQFAAPSETTRGILERLGGMASRTSSAAMAPIPTPQPRMQSPTGMEPTAAPMPEGGMPLPQPGGKAVQGLNGEFSRRVQALMQAVKAAGGELYIFSGARDAARQATLWQQALQKYGSEQEARKWVAPPGKSNHDPTAGMKKGLGEGALAADLRGDLAIAHKLAAQYGLVFPLSNEAWHIELAGARGK